MRIGQRFRIWARWVNNGKVYRGEIIRGMSYEEVQAFARSFHFGWSRFEHGILESEGLFVFAAPTPLKTIFYVETESFVR